jgi:hypothetical protein
VLAQDKAPIGHSIREVTQIDPAIQPVFEAVAVPGPPMMIDSKLVGVVASSGAKPGSMRRCEAGWQAYRREG